eukprot:CAMPEP_0184037634 /NCGR_PEP_ID=MMETSP0955-20130417/41038_1 /TAXON_ID=627963 /ORGANISM="Aplanochytrium sp, Strain PBS07" /LENGTH=495 /DNA_ID=CAMNT_0026325839 /DNA_START=131 /DNA_END=1618 /DNA_ORIENTATION=-
MTTQAPTLTVDMKAGPEEIKSQHKIRNEASNSIVAIVLEIVQTSAICLGIFWLSLEEYLKYNTAINRVKESENLTEILEFLGNEVEIVKESNEAQNIRLTYLFLAILAGLHGFFFLSLLLVKKFPCCDRKITPNKDQSSYASWVLSHVSYQLWYSDALALFILSILDGGFEKSIFIGGAKDFSPVFLPLLFNLLFEGYSKMRTSYVMVSTPNVFVAYWQQCRVGNVTLEYSDSFKDIDGIRIDDLKKVVGNNNGSGFDAPVPFSEKEATQPTDQACCKLSGLFIVMRVLVDFASASANGVFSTILLAPFYNMIYFGFVIFVGSAYGVYLFCCRSSPFLSGFIPFKEPKPTDEETDEVPDEDESQNATEKGKQNTKMTNFFAEFENDNGKKTFWFRGAMMVVKIAILLTIIIMDDVEVSTYVTLYIELGYYAAALLANIVFVECRRSKSEWARLQPFDRYTNTVYTLQTHWSVEGEMKIFGLQQGQIQNIQYVPAP